MAQQTQDSIMEWQSLLDIGFLWAGRDYAQAGHWFRRSLDLAQKLSDPKLPARSLNRVGNWLVNTGRVADGLQKHRKLLPCLKRSRTPRAWQKHSNFWAWLTASMGIQCRQ